MTSTYFLCACLVMTSLIPRFAIAQQSAKIENDFAELNRGLVDKAAADRYGDLLLNGLYGLPKPEDVDEMYGELTLSKESRISEFRITPEHVGKILALFQGAKIQTDPILSMPEVASLKIWTKDGRFHRISIYGRAQLPMNFTLHGIRCTINRPPQDHLDESKIAIELLKDAYKECKGR